MAKKEVKKPSVDLLKESKKHTKTALRLLKGLKKIKQGTAAYDNALSKVIEVFELALTAVTTHRSAIEKTLKKAPVKKKAPIKKAKK